jgi:methylphosphotriester-DNA--protein-cysteine methyltransferase
VLVNKNNNFEGIFRESSGSTSETKKIQFEQFQDEENNYLIIDTPGIGDTKMSDNEVLDIIAEAVYLVREGASQIFFVVSGRFDQSEMATYNLLRTIIFDENITEYTTIARTRFADFRSKKKCEEDVELMIQESQEKKIELEKQIAEKNQQLKTFSSDSEEVKKSEKEIEQLSKELKSTLSEIIESCQSKVVHVDNKPDKRIRNKSREKLLRHLRQNYQKDYQPKKLKELSKDIAEDMDKLLQSRAELEKEMENIRSKNNIRTIQIKNNEDKPENTSENIDQTFQKSKEIIKDNNLAIGSKTKELEDKKDRLRREIADKEKIIRQKVLKHIFNNIDNISNELGGDIFMDSVVGEHKWEDISSEFSDKKLVLK